MNFGDGNELSGTVMAEDEAAAIGGEILAFLWAYFARVLCVFLSSIAFSACGF